jgi:acyl-coenzyme A thioesterase PaaI-like protein
MATIGQAISFLRPVAKDDALIEARVRRLGQTLAFGEIALRAAGNGALVAHATTTYALPAER